MMWSKAHERSSVAMEKVRDYILVQREWERTKGVSRKPKENRPGISKKCRLHADKERQSLAEKTVQLAQNDIKAQIEPSS